MKLGEEDRRTLRLLLVVAAGFALGVGYLLYIIATDL